MNSEPQGQTSSGTPRAVLPNMKMQPPMDDGSQSLGQGIGGDGYGPVMSKNGGSSGSDVNSDVINPYASADSNSVPATTDVSADRVQQINPGAQTLGEC